MGYSAWVGKRVRVKDILIFADPDSRYEDIFIGKTGEVTGEEDGWLTMRFDVPFTVPDLKKKDGSPWEKEGETFLAEELEILE